MTTYYNEHDRCAAQWLRDLTRFGDITPGFVDDRDIQQVASDDIREYNRCHFFAGIGGWDYACSLTGWDGPIWTASLPCQPFSVAGKQRGTDDERHLWPAFRDLVAKCLPSVLVGEQIASKPGRAWLAAVQADMEALGYAVVAADLCAAGVGAPHIRQRLYWGAVRMADASSSSARERGEPGSQEGPWSEPRHNDDGCVDGVAHPERQRLEGLARAGDDGNQPGRHNEKPPRSAPESVWADAQWLSCADGKARPIEPGLEPLAHGVSGRVGLLRGYGNAIVPQVAAAFLTSLRESL